MKRHGIDIIAFMMAALLLFTIASCRFEMDAPPGGGGGTGDGEGTGGGSPEKVTYMLRVRGTALVGDAPSLRSVEAAPSVTFSSGKFMVNDQDRTADLVPVAGQPALEAAAPGDTVNNVEFELPVTADADITLEAEPKEGFIFEEWELKEYLTPGEELLEDEIGDWLEEEIDGAERGKSKALTIPKEKAHWVELLAPEYDHGFEVDLSSHQSVDAFMEKMTDYGEDELTLILKGIGSQDVALNYIFRLFGVYDVEGSDNAPHDDMILKDLEELKLVYVPMSPDTDPPAHGGSMCFMIPSLEVELKGFSFEGNALIELSDTSEIELADSTVEGNMLIDAMSDDEVGFSVKDTTIGGDLQLRLEGGCMEAELENVTMTGILDLSGSTGSVEISGSSMEAILIDSNDAMEIVFDDGQREIEILKSIDM